MQAFTIHHIAQALSMTMTPGHDKSTDRAAAIGQLTLCTDRLSNQLKPTSVAAAIATQGHNPRMSPTPDLRTRNAFAPPLSYG